MPPARMRFIVVRFSGEGTSPAAAADARTSTGLRTGAAARVAWTRVCFMVRAILVCVVCVGVRGTRGLACQKGGGAMAMRANRIWG